MSRREIFWFVVALIVGGVSGSMISMEVKAPEPVGPLHRMEQKIDTLQHQVDSLRQTIEGHKLVPTSEVTATAYHAVERQTDGTPTILADGTRVNPWQAEHERIIAVSRDLLRRYGGPLQFGERVYIRGTPDRDGFYVVRDTMHPRFTKRIDFLLSIGQTAFKYDSVQLYEIG